MAAIPPWTAGGVPGPDTYLHRPEGEGGRASRALGYFTLPRSLPAHRKTWGAAKSKQHHKVGMELYEIKVGSRLEAVKLKSGLAQRLAGHSQVTTTARYAWRGCPRNRRFVVRRQARHRDRQGDGHL